MECPILFSEPSPHFFLCSAAAVLASVWTTYDDMSSMDILIVTAFHERYVIPENIQNNIDGGYE